MRRAGLSGIPEGRNSLLAFPFGPSSLDFRDIHVWRCVRAGVHREPGNNGGWVVDGTGMETARVSLSSGRNEVLHLTGVYTI